MSPIQASDIERLLRAAEDDGRVGLFEHECYELLTAIGAEAAPTSRLVPVGSQPTQDDLDAISGHSVVLKVVSPDITHKTEAGGVRIVPNELGVVQRTFEAMLDEVPEIYARYLESRACDAGDASQSLTGPALAERLRKRLVGVLLCRCMEADAEGFATQLFVGIRRTAEFGPIISAGLGGVEMEVLSEATTKGSAIAIAPTGSTDGRRFLDLFRGTLSYTRLAGHMRGSSRLVDDDVLAQCFQAFIDTANTFSEVDPRAELHIDEMEVNPFVVVDGRIAPLDGVCSFSRAEEPVPARPVRKIESLLEPKSAAVIGVSSKGMNMGRIILSNMLHAGFDQDRTYVVRPGLDEIDGVRCVPAIAELPEKVDLFVVAVGADQVPDVITELIEHDRAEAVILIPGGLGEKEGSQDLERRLKARIRESHQTEDGGPVFIGGNSLGVISHPGRYDTMFIPETKLAKSRGDHSRNTCFISQSGAFIIANLSRMPWLDPAFALSIGNQIDITAADLLGFIKDDPRIEVFAVYMEGFNPGDGLAFARAVQETVAAGKDVVFYKAGRTTEGRSATAGHTASVAGDYDVCESSLAQAGAMVVSTFEEFADLLRLCKMLRGRRVGGRRLAAVSNAGYESVGMADSIGCGRASLKLTRFDPATADRLTATLEQYKLDGLVDVKNPFDVTPMANDAAFSQLLEAILDDRATDLVVAGIVPLTPAMQTLAEGDGHRESVLDPNSICQLLPKVVAGRDKPVVAVVDSGERFDAMENALASGGLPVFRSADRAVRVLCRWVDAKMTRG